MKIKVKSLEARNKNERMKEQERRRGKMEVKMWKDNVQGIERDKEMYGQDEKKVR